MFLVTGATGTVGRAVVDALLAAGYPVRALTRRPETAALPTAAEVVGADLDDPDSLPAALDGVDRIFLATAGPAIARHDHNLARAAVRAGVGHLVKLSSGRVEEADATDPIPAWHRAGEVAVRASGVPWTILRPLGFMSNALHWGPSVRARDTVFAPFGQGGIAVIDPDDIAAAAVAVLTEPGHQGQAYLLSGPRSLTPGEQTAVLAEVLGRPLRYVEISPDEARDALLRFGVDAEMADAIMALRASALASFTSVVHPGVEKLTGRPPVTFRDWAVRHRSAFE